MDKIRYLMVAYFFLDNYKIKSYTICDNESISYTKVVVL